jgi:hypothetical protein
MRRTLLALALLLAASPLAGYLIVFKDGTTLEAKEKYKVQGKMAVITLPSGAQSQYPLDRIDVAKTDAKNFGSAQVLSDASQRPTPPPTPPPPSLSDVAGQHRSLLPPPPPPHATPKPTPAVLAQGDGGKSETAATAAHVDFLRLARVPASNVVIAGAVGDAMRAHGVTRASIYDGSQPRRLLVEVAANSEGGVFQAIGATAQAILEVQAKHPGGLDALELFVATDNRQRAGQFLITPERAQELVTRQLDLTAFYLKYVEF